MPCFPAHYFWRFGLVWVLFYDSFAIRSQNGNGADSPQRMENAEGTVSLFFLLQWLETFRTLGESPRMPTAGKSCASGHFSLFVRPGKPRKLLHTYIHCPDAATLSLARRSEEQDVRKWISLMHLWRCNDAADRLDRVGASESEMEIAGWWVYVGVVPLIGSKRHPGRLNVSKRVVLEIEINVWYGSLASLANTAAAEVLCSCRAYKI